MCGPDDVGPDREVFDLLNVHRACDKSQPTPRISVPLFSRPLHTLQSGSVFVAEFFGNEQEFRIGLDSQFSGVLAQSFDIGFHPQAHPAVEKLPDDP